MQKSREYGIYLDTKYKFPLKGHFKKVEKHHTYILKIFHPRQNIKIAFQKVAKRPKNWKNIAISKYMRMLYCS